MKKLKKVKGQLDIFEDTKENSVLSWLLVKENRMKFFKQVYKLWDQDAIDPFFNTNGKWHVVIPKKEWDNYQMVANLLKIRDSFENIPNSPKCGAKDCYVIYQEYWDRVNKYVLKKVKANGGHFPTLQTTKAIGEFLKRGFIHINDTDPEIFKLSHIIIYAHEGNLVWPVTYESHMDALKQMDRVGIPGRTGTKIPK